jgi:phenylacetate-coenzyme A ligase PaaK-like adenylate-forming protein
MEHFKSVSVEEIAAISSLEEFSFKLPETTKDHLSKNRFTEFVPKLDNSLREWDQNKGYFRNKGTGGTTGKPVTVLYSSEDWRAMSQHIARSIKFDWKEKLRELKGLKVLGMYHGDHVTNEVYQAGLSLLGVEFFNRVSTKNDVVSLYNFIQELKPNMILAPPEDGTGTQTKGSTLDMFFKLDARNTDPNAYRLSSKVNPEFNEVLWSSMPMSQDLQSYMLNHLQVPYQQAQYGSTEICPTGATCSKYPRDFHLGYGPTLVLIKHSTEKRLVEDAEFGEVLVSKVGATRADGKNIVPTGTVLVNFNTGDYAQIIQKDGEVCECGRNTPILYKVHRVKNIEAKAQFGCQVD